LLGAAQFLTGGRETARPASFISFDAGRTWRDNGPLPLPSGYAFGDDVSAVFTHVGTGLVAVEVYRRGGGSAIVVWRSLDGGRTFGAPLTVYSNADTTRNTDHPSLAAQAGARPYLYLAWSFGNRILFSRSTDDGKRFTRAIAVSAPADSHPDWAVTTSARGGAVYVVYQAGGPAPFEMVSSSDYGRRFGAPTSPPTPPAGQYSGAVSTLLGAAGDPRTESVFVARAAASPAGSELQILLWRSADGGRSWSTPTSVTGGTSDHFQPQVIVDAAGEVDVAYFALAHGLVREYLARLSGTGSKSVYHRTIGATSFDPARGVAGKGGTGGKGGSAWIGDYQALAAGPGAVYPLWNDARTGRLELYIAVVPA
jgi:hypothetical protein